MKGQLVIKKKARGYCVHVDGKPNSLLDLSGLNYWWENKEYQKRYCYVNSRDVAVRAKNMFVELENYKARAEKAMKKNGNEDE